MTRVAALLFLAVLAIVCYLRPVPDDFDRYIYEAIARSKSQAIDVVYDAVRHESKRTEESPVLDSPAHLQEVEPLFAIRPLYTELIYGLSRAGLPFQHAINLISALSLFGIGVVVLWWTDNPLLTCLLMASWQVLYLGRFGTPDGLSTLFVIGSLWAAESHAARSVILLFASLLVRTDNILLLLILLAWFVAKGKLGRLTGVLSAVLAALVVMAIHRWFHNPGWVVLFRLSFIGGTFPSRVPHSLTLLEYAGAFGRGLFGLLSQIALWGILGIVTWVKTRHPLLVLASTAAAAHFVLYPSPEVRYLLWWCVTMGILFVRLVASSRPTPLAVSTNA